MVTDRDIFCKGLASNNFDARRATARDVMTEGIHYCREDDDLAKAMQHMGKLQLRRAAGDQQEQADGRHHQSRRRQPFRIRRCAVRVRQERFGPSLKGGRR